jgi:hypothetical protein
LTVKLFRRTSRNLAFLLLVLVFVSASPAAAETRQDLQQWSLVFLNHHIDDRWAVSFQVENRIADDINQFDELILKPGGSRTHESLRRAGLKCSAWTPGRGS